MWIVHFLWAKYIKLFVGTLCLYLLISSAVLRRFWKMAIKVLHPMAHSCRGATACADTLCPRLTKHTAGSREGKKNLFRNRISSVFTALVLLLSLVRFHFIFGCIITQNSYKFWKGLKLDFEQVWHHYAHLQAEKGYVKLPRYYKTENAHVKLKSQMGRKRKCLTVSFVFCFARSVLKHVQKASPHTHSIPAVEGFGFSSRYGANKCTNTSWSLDRLIKVSKQSQF